MRPSPAACPGLFLRRVQRPVGSEGPAPIAAEGHVQAPCQGVGKRGPSPSILSWTRHCHSMGLIFPLSS